MQIRHLLSQSEQGNAIGDNNYVDAFRELHNRVKQKNRALSEFDQNLRQLYDQNQLVIDNSEEFKLIFQYISLCLSIEDTFSLFDRIRVKDNRGDERKFMYNTFVNRLFNRQCSLPLRFIIFKDISFHAQQADILRTYESEDCSRHQKLLDVYQKVVSNKKDVEKKFIKKVLLYFKSPTDLERYILEHVGILRKRKTLSILNSQFKKFFYTVRYCRSFIYYHITQPRILKYTINLVIIILLAYLGVRTLNECSHTKEILEQIGKLNEQTLTSVN